MAELYVRRPKSYLHIVAIIVLAFLTLAVTLLAGHKSAAKRVSTIDLDRHAVTHVYG